MMVLTLLSGYCFNALVVVVVVVAAVAEGYPLRPYTSELSSYSFYSSFSSLKEQRIRSSRDSNSSTSSSSNSSSNGSSNGNGNGNSSTSTVTVTTANSARTDIVIFLRDNCDDRFDTKEIQEFIAAYQKTAKFTVSLIQRSLTCETKSRGLGVLVQALGRTSTKALIAALDKNTCEVVARLAHLWDKPLLTWTCPLRFIEQKELSSTVRLSPSVPAVAQALAQVFLHFRWKTVAIVGTDYEPWSSVDRSVVRALRSIGIVPRHHAVLSYHGTSRQVHGTLRVLQTLSCRAIVLCLPLEDEMFAKRVIAELDTMRESRSTNFVIVLVHPEAPNLFLPSADVAISLPFPYFTSSYSPLTNDRDDESTTAPMLESSSSSPVTIKSYPRSSLNYSTVDSSRLTRNAVGVDGGGGGGGGGSDDGNTTTATIRNNEKIKAAKRFPPLKNSDFELPRNLLVIAPFDRSCDLEKIYNGSEEYTESVSIVNRLNESLNILTRDNSSIDTNNNKMYTYGILAWLDNRWRPILQVVEHEERLLVRQLLENNLTNTETFDVFCEDENDCSADLTSILPLTTTRVLATIAGSLLFALIALAIALLIRRHLLNKRMSKGPYKIVLTASDFVFPQVPDSRRVDEGIEAMLCCWLQQLQEFGGPEVEKPDLLQGNVGSLKPAHGIQTGTGSLIKHPILKDPRARYNGDLVQLKDLPCQSNFELKSKAMDVLVAVHGLRHENLNPLIGCLTDPARPCLVSEYCSRGSLEDVLVQDEIKLDWSFRLSLLTDLVRVSTSDRHAPIKGMKYLHSSPIRVHGYLTSRNCVIDARWVLKVTDYGLPAFYEAQNILPPTKTARDLLWTAPELLRHANYWKRGSQPGDVYSFGIIMQEVVVRGEPFCMLALSPEDIIEKVKKPPPLIRPSVSKGAAPPEAINIMRQCWAEAADMRPDFNAVNDLFKKLNHGRKVNFVDTMFQMLEKYSNNLEELIRERTEQLDMEKKKTEQLLNRMLPSSVAEKLKLGMPVDPEEFGEVTIYFSDIVGFTTISAYSTPFQVVDLLNDLYTCFDATINAYTVYKVETIGDAYMVVGGCPVRISDHASQIATMALDLLHQSGKFKLKHLPKTQLRLRIGLHTGPCCAGVVGLTMPRYCLFGDTVNTASRMESTGAPWRIHLSQATRDRLNEVGGYRIEYRGRTDVKGKGKMPTYWLLGKQGFDKQLPTPPSLGLEESLIMGSLSASTDDSVTAIGQQHLQFEGGSTGSDGKNSGEECGFSFVTSFESERQCGDHSAESSSVRNSRDPTVESSSGPATSTLLDSSMAIDASGGTTFSELPKTVRKTAVSVHDERNLVGFAGSTPCSNYSIKTSEAAVEILRDIVKTPGEYGSGTVVKSTSGDTQISLGIPVSATEVAAALLGASNNSLTSIQGSAFRGRHKRLGGVIGEEDDLSTPYNHYRCLSPNEHYGKSSSGRILKRQFSVDRPDEPVSIISDQHPSSRPTPRLYKQNSAGAANDLERIEEVPSGSSPRGHQHSRRDQIYRHAASMSLSVESLTLR